MSFLFATEVELGYDSKVTLYRDGDIEQYTYEMPQQYVPGVLQFYRTIKPIAQYHTNNITGRMCRIWLVAAVNSPTDPNPIGDVKKRILKDVWLERTAKTELQLQTLNFKTSKTHYPRLKMIGKRTQMPGLSTLKMHNSSKMLGKWMRIPRPSRLNSPNSSKIKATRSFSLRGGMFEGNRTRSEANNRALRKPRTKNNASTQFSEVPGNTQHSRAKSSSSFTNI